VDYRIGTVISASVTVYVGVRPTSVSVEPLVGEVEVGSTVSLHVSVLSENAKVDTDGIVTVVAPGTVSISLAAAKYWFGEACVLA